MKILNLFNFKWLSHTLRKTLLIFLIGFCMYPTLEIIWNTIFTPFGYKTFVGLFSMGILGGVLLVILGNINEIKIIRENLSPWLQALLGGIIITVMEFIFGVVLNIGFNLNVWNYSNLPFNILGQVCLFYTLFWTILSPFAFWLDDIFRMAYNKMCCDFIKPDTYKINKNYNTVNIDIGSTKDLKYRYKHFFKNNFYSS
jgi:hypothetical protein